MPILTDEAEQLPLPNLWPVRQIFDAPRLADVSGALCQSLDRPEICEHIRPGMRVALAVGSRGIRDLVPAVQTVLDFMRSRGAQPFIVPAMGSHGGGTAHGQRQVLAHYGITESALGVPILDSMETRVIGSTLSGLPIHLAATALDADLIVPIARIKPHTDFRGPIESGLGKMLAIGLGKHTGCSSLHREGFARFGVLMPEVAQLILNRAKVGFGVAIVENAYDETALIEAVPAARFLAREPELLLEAKRLMPRLPFDRIDVLILKKIGKEISGAGMDPNIVGRTTVGPLPGFDGPAIGRIIVLGLSEASKGNAIGLGLADFTVDAILPHIDREQTYSNCIASGNPEAGRIPITLADEAQAIRAALACTPDVDPSRPRIVRVESTLEVAQLEISDALLDEARRHPRLQLLDA